MAVHFTTSLSRREGVYYFRKATPVALKKSFIKPEIKVSLKTRNPNIARMRCREVSNFIDQLCSVINGMALVPQKAIEDIIKRYFEQLVAKSNELIEILPQDPKADPELEVQGAIEDEKRLQDRLAKNDLGGSAKNTALELLNDAGLQLSAHDELFSFLCRGVLRAEKENHRIFKEKMLGNYDQTIPKDTLFVGCDLESKSPIPGENSGSHDSVRQLIDEYVAIKSKKAWGHKSRLENVRVLEWFLAFGHENHKIQHITRLHIQEFRGALLDMPPNFAKNSEFKGMGLREILAKKKTKQTISNKTIEKYFFALKAFFNWCEDEGIIDINPADKVKLKGIIKVQPKSAREPFSAEDLVALFSSPVYGGCKSKSRRAVKGELVIRDALFWIPLVFLYTGMRPSEICQLRPEDVRTDGGIEYFDVNVEDGKSTKVHYSIRKIPVHDVLKAIGFLEFCQGRADRKRIFYDVKVAANGDPSQNFSKQFANYVKKAGLQKNNITLYSLRHNFRDALSRANVQDSVIKRLMGHKVGNITFDKYGSMFPPSKTYKDLNSVSYPIDLKFLYT